MLLRLLEALCWLVAFLSVVAMKVLRALADFVHVQLIRLLHLLERCALWCARMYKSTEAYVRMFSVRLVWLLVQLLRLSIAFTPAIGAGIGYLYWQREFLLWSAAGWTLLLLVIGVVLSVKMKNQIEVRALTPEDFARMEQSLVAELIIAIFRCMPGILAFVLSWFIQGKIMPGLCFWGGIVWMIAPLGLFALAVIGEFVPDSVAQVSTQPQEPRSDPPPVPGRPCKTGYEVHMRHGKIQSRGGEYDLAIQSFSFAIELRPDSALAFQKRGDVYRLKRNYDQAIKDCSRAIELDPKLVEAFWSRGSAHRWKGNLDQAIDDLTKAIELDPKYAFSYASRGETHRQKGNLDQAIDDLTKAIELDPKSDCSFGRRGAAYRQKGNLDQAIDDLTKAIELDPKEAEWFEWRAQAYEARGDAEKAASDRTEAQRLKSG
ncbi:MAG: tetratricopeptide repeat protein [Candidatus Peribacteraceae bacterium]|nr:tetratricopeptide repeat protein [Candidatus Peribacteraceae bacterium]